MSLETPGKGHTPNSDLLFSWRWSTQLYTDILFFFGTTTMGDLHSLTVG